jgi:hypothetical protein
MSSNSKTKPAFPGRTGTGIESGLSKLEYITVQLVASNVNLQVISSTHQQSLIVSAVSIAKQIISACEAAEKAGQ